MTSCSGTKPPGLGFDSINFFPMGLRIPSNSFESLSIPSSPFESFLTLSVRPDNEITKFYSINKKTKSKTDMPTIESSVTELNAYSHHPLRNIRSLGDKPYGNWKYLSQIDFSSSKNRHELNKALNKCFRPTEIGPETIGSFLFGCTQKTYGEVCKECSPLCHQSLLSSELSKCPYKTWILTNSNSDQRLREINTDHQVNQGYVFVEDNFDGFTPDEINIFRSQKMGNISIFSLQSGKHYTISKEIPINSLPRRIRTPRRSLSIRSIGSEIFEEKNQSYVLIVIVIIVFVVIVVLFSAK